MKHYLFTFLIFLCFTFTHLHAIPEIVLHENSIEESNFLIEHLVESPEKALNIDTVQNLSFKPISNKFTFGYNSAPIWLRFSIRNYSNKQRTMILEVTEPFHKTSDLYIINSSIIHKSNGLSIPLRERKIKEYNPAFTLIFKPQETKLLYLKLESTYGVFGSVQLKTYEKFYADTRIQNNFMVFFFGATLIIALYNLFIFFYLKERIYLYYVSYVLFFATWASLYSGFAISYFSIKVFDLLQVSVPSFLIMLTLFSQSILETKQFFSRIHKLLNYFIFLIGLTLIWMLFSIHTGFYLMNIAATPLLPILLITAILSSLQGHKLAIIYTLALITYIISMTLIGLLSLGLVPYSNLIRNAPIIGSLIEIVLFSLALAYRINLLRHEKLDSQTKLLEQERTESTRLWSMVEQQTATLKEVNTKLEIQASTDSLTGILNRKSFFEQCTNEVERVKRYGGSLSFLILDIDLFKKVNDTYGHLAGDSVLIAVTHKINLQLRSTDIFARVGGEEFTLLMPNTTIEHTLQLAERIRESVSQSTITAEEQVIPITISIGVSEYNTKEDIIQPTFKRADEALYRAKENGRNQVCSSFT